MSSTQAAAGAKAVSPAACQTATWTLELQGSALKRWGMFRLDQNAYTGGTCLLDVTYLPPAFVVARFGPSDRGAHGLSTGHWTFVDDGGELLTLYEYRSTSVTYP